MKRRINKYLSEIGYCSRREGDRLIKEGVITVNDLPVEIGQKVDEDDVVKVKGKIVENKTQLVYLALNKPKGITSTTDQTDPTNIVDFVKFPSRIFHIGRLDKDSEGLILLTNDGDIVNKILRSDNKHEKEYVVKVDQRITPSFTRSLSKGIPILDTVTKPCYVERIDDFHFRIILTQGLNRQIRRMCNYLGYHVVRLMRVRIMNIELDTKVGKWRHLSNAEVTELKESLIDSSKTEEASG